MLEVTKKHPTNQQSFYSIQENKNTITIKINIPKKEDTKLRTLVKNFVKKIKKEQNEYITDWSFLTDSIPYKGTPSYKAAAQSLKAYRLRENMTQKTVSTKLNIKQSNLSLMETGKRPIGKKLAKKLGDLLNTSSEYSLTGLE